MEINLPVLIIGYNRPEKITNLILNLRKFKPKKIYFSVDGPNSKKENDYINVALCRRSVEYIDWKCEIHTRFLDKNFGCRDAVITAINWAFNYEEFLLILEDDIEINPSFFRISEILLAKYRSDPDIFAICASNISDIDETEFIEDYYFTKYFSGWGWATWKDKWQLYNKNIFEMTKINFLQILKENNFNIFVTLYFYYNFNLIKNKRLDTWDYQINQLIINSNLGVLKMSRNLSKNTGIGEFATHTTVLPYIKYFDREICEIKHPRELKVDSKKEALHRKNLIRNLLKVIKND